MHLSRVDGWFVVSYIAMLYPGRRSTTTLSSRQHHEAESRQRPLGIPPVLLYSAGLPCREDGKEKKKEIGQQTGRDDRIKRPREKEFNVTLAHVKDPFLHIPKYLTCCN